jgi:hypothetical protein
MHRRQDLKQVVTYSRLIRRSQATALFWREKVYEIVGNYRLWRKSLAPQQGLIAKNYTLIQQRRIRRLVAQAFVEYRRAQAQTATLQELSAHTAKRIAEVDGKLQLAASNQPKTVWAAVAEKRP